MKFREHFKKNIIPKLQKELNIANKHAVPKIKLIKINVRIGSYLAGSKDYSEVVKNIAEITGQKPIVTKAKKAISNFKLRAGMPVGVVVTLRKDRMYDFLNKIINVVLPRTRDFRGVSVRSFDGHGNYSIGIKEFTIFPEIKPDDVVKNFGMQITIVTTALDNKLGYKLLRQLGFPFKKEEVAGITS